ncbi:MAG TPA: sulfite exporter TauE/SafE family protein [Candidatus Binatia bacterium]
MELNSTTLLVFVCLLAAAFMKGVTGMGFPLIATPILTLLLDIRSAVVVLIVPSMLMDVTQISRGVFPVALVKRLFGFVLLGVIGAYLGTGFLVTLPLWILNLCLGSAVLIFVAINLLQPDLKISSNAEKVLSPMVGFGAGFLNGMTNVSGPVLAMYFYGLKLSKTEFVKAAAVIFFILKCGQIVALSSWNQFTWPLFRLSLMLIVLLCAGFYAGLKTQDRVNQRIFNHGLLFILLIIGVTLVFRALR